MSHRNILKNQSVKKLKKIHMRSILSEVKNKQMIQEIDNSKKFNQSFNIHQKLNWKEDVKVNPLRAKKLQINQVFFNKNTDQNMQKQILVLPTSIDSQREQQQQGRMTKKKMKTTQTARRSSKLQIQLHQIMKYSQLYPSRNSSQQLINSSLKRMTNQGFYPLHQKSKFQRSVECIKGVKRQDMILDLTNNFAVGQSDQDRSKRESTHYLLRKSKEILSSCHRKKLDLSLTNIIQNQVAAIKLKKDRKTVGFQHYKHENEPLDIRDENMHKFHQFLRGPDQEDREIENYLTTKQVSLFQNKFDIYSKVYKKVKQGLNEDKIDMSKISALTVKNAVFLNESLIQSNQRSKKIEVQDIMKKFQFYN